MDIYYILMICSIITTVISFPAPILFDSVYSYQETIMCDENIDNEANALCMRHLPDFKFHLEEIHQTRGLELTSICCIEMCTAGQIFEEYCLDGRTESSTTTTIPNKVTTNGYGFDQLPRPIRFWDWYTEFLNKSLYTGPF